MGGVTGGSRMSTWEYSAMNGVTAEYGKLTGWIALQTQGATVSDMSYWDSGKNSPPKLPNAMAIAKDQYDRVKPTLVRLQ